MTAPSHDDRDAVAAGAETFGGVTLVLPDTLGEYERALAEVEGLGRSSAGDEPAQPGEDGPHGLAAASGAYVVTNSEQRRVWGLPDLVDVCGGRGAVTPYPLADASDAVSLLVGAAAGRRPPLTTAAAAPGRGSAAHRRRRPRLPMS